MPGPARQDPPALIELINQGRSNDAERAAHALLQGEPESGVLWKILGVALDRQGKDPLVALRRAAELMPEDAEAQRNLGAALYERGKLEEALVSMGRSLELAPRDVAVLVASGTALCTLGRPREAVDLFERAVQIEPRQHEAHTNLGNALQELGELERAVDCYRRALALKPDDAETYCNLSNALRQLGQLQDALNCSRRALAFAPNLSVAHNNLGLTLAALGQRAEAVAAFRRAVQLNPHFVEALNNLGNLLRDLGEHRDSCSCYREAVELQPERAENHVNLGGALYELGEFSEAAASYRRALALRSDHLPAHLGLAAALRPQGGVSEAEELCRAALGIEPKSAPALALLGDLCTDRGEFGQAQELFQRALAIDPESAPVFCSIAAHRKMTAADDPWREGAEALLAKRLPLAHEIALRYALGKYHDDLRQYDAAFSHYRLANELSKRCDPPYDADQLTRHIDEAIECFDMAFVRELQNGASDRELPVFVVGMPRSGTSLAEQILASHPQVFGAGEVTFWEHASAAFGRAGPRAASAASAISRTAREYLERVTVSADGALRVVDKMPANFLYAGLIHTVFPRAKILHMQRNPIDTCLSIYFQNFVGMRPYASDLDTLAHYYRQYMRITSHWRTVLPATTWLDIPYEALIKEQEHWTRRMLEFIGLPWHPRCLEFDRTERVVITASRWQVRQKINAGSVERWRNYARYLAPLRPLIELVGTDRSPQS